jgi:hypothetical protein
MIPHLSGAKDIMYTRSRGYLPSVPRHIITSISRVKDTMYPSEGTDTMYYSGAKVIVCPEAMISCIFRSKGHASRIPQEPRIPRIPLSRGYHVSPRAKDSMHLSGAENIMYFLEPRIPGIPRSKGYHVSLRSRGYHIFPEQRLPCIPWS